MRHNPLSTYGELRENSNAEPWYSSLPQLLIQPVYSDCKRSVDSSSASRRVICSLRPALACTLILLLWAPYHPTELVGAVFKHVEIPYHSHYLRNHSVFYRSVVTDVTVYQLCWQPWCAANQLAQNACLRAWHSWQTPFVAETEILNLATFVRKRATLF